VKDEKFFKNVSVFAFMQIADLRNLRSELLCMFIEHVISISNVGILKLREQCLIPQLNNYPFSV